MTDRKRFTTQDVAQQFYELAKQEKWFEIQDALFSEDITSTDPPGSEYLGYAAGKDKVRKKGEDWVKRISAVHHLHTTAPIVAAHHFVAGSAMDLDVAPFGRVQIHEIMLYEVRDGKIISEQFFY
ncbi:ester cyclase [Niabella pedocola]|uniref:Ester cyclase n=1 Tax=Niabella pedocola TaxID=1752077 RepID=A0ABS8PKC0_9BACT|nr:ester cyclase [Niabella pedocola]MCD2421543.1 ester cyclase [Niabella pedocola]